MADNSDMAENLALIHAEMCKLISALEEDDSLRDADRQSLIALHRRALAESNLESLKKDLLQFEPPVSEVKDAEKYLQLSEAAAALLNLLYQKVNLLAEAISPIAPTIALLNPKASPHEEVLDLQKQEEDAKQRIASVAALLNPKAGIHQEKLPIPKQEEQPADRIASAAVLLDPKAGIQEELAIQQQEEAIESIADVNGEQNLNARPRSIHFGERAEPPLKLEIRQLLSLSDDMTQYTKLGGKNGGARSAGKNGGVYKTHYTYSTPAGDLVENDQLILFKQDTDNDGHVIHDNVIAEYVAAKIMQYFVGDSAASVILATDGKTQLPDETGDNVYVGSVYYDKFTDLYLDLYHSQGLEPPKERPKLPSRAMINGMMNAKTKKSNYLDFERVVVASAMVGDTDVHSSNFGVTKEINAFGEEIKRLRKIDHGAALVDLEDELHIHSHSRHLPLIVRNGRLITQPVNQLLGYPRSLRISPEMAAEFDRIGDLSKGALFGTINQSIRDVAEYYGPRPLLAFAKRMGAILSPELVALNWEGLDPSKMYENKRRLVNEIQSYLNHRMLKRQESAKRLATDIKLSLAFSYVNGAFKEEKFTVNNKSYDLKEVILENPLYFLRNQMHFRGENHRFKLGLIKIKYFRERTLNNLVQAKLKDSLFEIAAKARFDKDPAIFENIFANTSLTEKLTPSELHSLQIAYQATLIETARDLISHSHHLFRSAHWQNDLPMYSKKLQHHIIESILQETAIEQRTMLIGRWITLMGLALKQYDFNTAITILQALKHPSIQHLQATFAGLAPSQKISLKAVEDTFRTPNFMNQYRNPKDAYRVIPSLILMDTKQQRELDQINWYRANLYPRKPAAPTALLKAIDVNEPKLREAAYSLAAKELEPVGKTLSAGKVLEKMPLLQNIYNNIAQQELTPKPFVKIDEKIIKELAALVVALKKDYLILQGRNESSKQQRNEDEDFFENPPAENHRPRSS